MGMSSGYEAPTTPDWGDLKSQVTRTVGDKKRLNVDKGGCPGGAVSGVSDGRLAGEFLDDFLIGKDLGDLTHSLVHVYGAFVGSNDPGRFLAAVL